MYVTIFRLLQYLNLDLVLAVNYTFFKVNGIYISYSRLMLSKSLVTYMHASSLLTITRYFIRVRTSLIRWPIFLFLFTLIFLISLRDMFHPDNPFLIIHMGFNCTYIFISTVLHFQETHQDTSPSGRPPPFNVFFADK